MKLFMLIIFLGTTLATSGQSNSKTHPLMFLDSINITDQRFVFDAAKIAGIKIDNHYSDSAKHVGGRVLITSENPKDFHFLTMADIKKEFNLPGNAPVIFMLDNELIKDSIIRIDSSYILKVEIEKGSEFNYLKNVIPDLTIIKVLLKTKENLFQSNKFFIRGTGATAAR